MLEYHGLSDPGRVRKNNEDTILLDPPTSFFAVCDGLGGQNAGEIASKLAAESLLGFIEKSHEDEDITWPYGVSKDLSFDGNRLFTAIGLANKSVFRAADGRPEYVGMGTTVVAVIVRGNLLTIGWVGDSRGYLLRKGTIEKLTQDHTWKGMALRNGTLTAEEAEKPHQWDHVLVKAVGGRDSVESDIAEKELESGDIILLCSDGLTPTMLKKDDEVLKLLTPPPDSLETGARTLVDAALELGGKDNVSVILLRYTEPSK